MIKFNCLLVSIFILNSISAQIKNPGFETINDSIPTLPEDWNCVKVDGYTIASDNSIQFTGKRSIRISNSEKQNENAPANVIQYISYKTETTKKLLFSAHVKKENLNGTAWLSARLTNPVTDDFFSIARKYVSEGSGNWEKISFLVITDREVKIRINAGLQGTGTVWFDDIKLEDVTGKDTAAVDPDAKELISQFMDTVKTHSLYADSVNWKKLGMEVADLSRGIKSMEEAHGILHYILSKLALLGDNHSHIIINPNNVIVTQADQVKNLAEIPESKYLEKNIGYIKIPAFNTSNDTAGRLFADMVQQVIKSIDQKHKVTGWIVDLREDAGGSIPPMVAGLFPLLGFDTLGYFVSSGEVDPWFTSKEDWNTLYVLKNKVSRIAVLIGPNTGSSGEATAISFIGKSNTKLFGQHSAGLTTANSTFNLRDGSLLALADGVEADRNMKIYHRGIDPDVVVKDDTDKRIDACLETAKKWILEK
jgi:hypothetical protein